MNEQPTHLDLFSGIGGFALAAGWAGFKTIGFCEIEPYCQAVLKKHWPSVPIHENIETLDGTAYRGVTLLTGGFPCQPFSCAGKQRGKNDDRYLWPQMLRVIQEARPAWIVGENVVGIISLALDQVCSDLEACGYEVEPIIIPACGVDAPHKRDRVWIVGHSKLDGLTTTKTSGGLLDKSKESEGQITERQSSGAGCSSANVADTISLPARSAYGGDGGGSNGQDKNIRQGSEVGGNSANSGKDVADSVSQRRCGGDTEGQYAEDAGQSPGHPWNHSGGVETWLPEPDVGRVANGIPNRTHRLKGLGNAIVPQVAYQIIKGIRELL